MKFNLKLFSAMLVMVVSIGTNANKAEADWEYTVNEGDSIWSLCKSYALDPLCWSKLVEYNQIKTPKYLSPGTVLKFPSFLGVLKAAKAQVTSVDGDVSFQKKHETHQQPLTLNQILQEGDAVETRQGTATLQFVDDSKLFINAHTQVNIQTLLHTHNKTVQTKINLAKGRVRALVKKISSEGGYYQVVTPAAVAAVRGTEFRVEMSDGATPVMITEVVKGKVKVANEVNGQLLYAGFSTHTQVGKAVEKPMPLLSRVTIVETIRKKHDAYFPLIFNWLPLTGAVTYKTQLFNENKPDTPVLENMDKEPTFVITQLPEGKYFIKVRAIDALGTQGFDRRVNVTVQLNPEHSKN
jgi:hypothetical protein